MFEKYFRKIFFVILYRTASHCISNWAYKYYKKKFQQKKGYMIFPTTETEKHLKTN